MQRNITKKTKPSKLDPELIVRLEQSINSYTLKSKRQTFDKNQSNINKKINQLKQF